jgi:hypothetical protein
MRNHFGVIKSLPIRDLADGVCSPPPATAMRVDGADLRRSKYKIKRSLKTLKGQNLLKKIPGGQCRILRHYGAGTRITPFTTAERRWTPSRIMRPRETRNGFPRARDSQKSGTICASKHWTTQARSGSSLDNRITPTPRRSRKVHTRPRDHGGGSRFIFEDTSARMPPTAAENIDAPNAFSVISRKTNYHRKDRLLENGRVFRLRGVNNRQCLQPLDLAAG